VLLDKIRQTINKYKMLRAGDKVVVGVSGGPDSVVLLDMLRQLSKEMNLSLYVAHLNHKLRGQEAEQDAQFVKKLAAKFDLPFTVKAADVAALARRHKMTLEEAARQKRYEFFEKAALKNKAGKIAVGHNADDEVETVMMWLLRGAGRTGLAGIPPVRKISPSGLTIIRPLIEVHRQEIKAYLKKHRLASRLDSSNLSPLFMRNKIRLKLLPMLRKEYSPNFDALILQTAGILREENEWLDKEVDKALKRLISRRLDWKISIDLNRLLRYNTGLQRQIIRRLVFLVSSGQVSLDYRKVEEIIGLVVAGKTNRRVILPGGLAVKKSYGLLEVTAGKETPRAKEAFSCKLKIPGTTNIKCLSLIIKTAVFDRPVNFRYSRSKFTAHLDRQKIRLPLVVRTRREGDRINPLGMRGYKKIKDIFIDNKIPPEKRADIPLIVSGDEVIWVTGYPAWREQISDRAKVTPETKKILEIRLIPKNR